MTLALIEVSEKEYFAKRLAHSHRATVLHVFGGLMIYKHFTKRNQIRAMSIYGADTQTFYLRKKATT
jgi:hypothetical protein